jgi:tRNA threonylcarbamoyladenosine biosynthesis protein TsaE
MASLTSEKNSWRFSSPRQMQAWGERFSALLRRGDAVALIGPLGAGKTTLVQGIVKGMGYKRGANSPTFALANEYKTSKGNVYHMDMYRLTPVELRAFPLEEYFSDGTCLLEWADRVKDRWPAGTLALNLEILSPRRRLLKALDPAGLWRDRLKKLR